jgi:hypothetical protein
MAILLDVFSEVNPTEAAQIDNLDAPAEVEPTGPSADDA